MKEFVSLMLIGLLYGIHTASAAPHSLKYFYTAFTGVSGLPEYTDVGLLDDEPFTRYDSNIKRAIPSADWIKENVGADYWDRETQKALGSQQSFKANIGIAMQRLNQTHGVHTLQWMYGCEWDDESGATGGFNQFGYDGEDFIIYDMKNQRYIAPVQPAFITAMKWNNNPAQLEKDKQYLTNECVDWLKKYVRYGKSSLERTVRPQVCLLQKDPSSSVTCHVTGFYPRGVMVTWQKDGQDLDVDVELGETVPNGDGTFQTRSHLRVKPEDWKRDRYTCTVQHKSLDQDIVLTVGEVRPQVSLLQKDPSSPVICYVTGFYSPGIMVTWQKNGQDLDVDVELGEMGPNEDGTFQTRSHLRVKPEDWKRDRYTCTVQHKSLEQDIILPVTEENIKRSMDIKIRPQVSLLQKDPSSPVTCHVTGFYPPDIMVTWQKNGQDLHVDVELKETVPNEDGTFQTRSHLRVKPEDLKRNSYACTVQHKSLGQNIILPVTEENIKKNMDIRPQVSLLQKDPSSPVTCYVTGFYPPDIMVTWQKNGQDLHVDVELKETVPNEDGTFQTRSHLRVKPEDLKRNSYACTVQHKSLGQNIILPVTEENIKKNMDTRTINPDGSGSSTGIIIGCVVGALILLAAIGVFMWKKRSSDYGRTSTTDTNSANLCH
ncbi:hypothetical protein GJAV_G00104920 [Gymnothorax javanicus]|nr:hypothetical protein GJAV_G00104920 [Gymnothorax javanicus]